jgi:prolyl-tRNA synthetase
MLKMSTLFLRTLRDDPADAEVASHKLLVRAGYVRRIAAFLIARIARSATSVRRSRRFPRSEGFDPSKPDDLRRLKLIEKDDDVRSK